MTKYCKNCNKANNDSSNFCVHCGSRIYEIKNSYYESQFEKTKQSSFNQMNMNSYYGQNYVNNTSVNNKKKPWIITITIFTAILLIIAGLYFAFYNSTEEKVNELDVMLKNIGDKMDKAPKASLQSLASGNIPCIPDENCLVKYYLYYNDEKIGDLIIGNTGTEYYNGKSCYKLLGRTNVDIEVNDIAIAFQMDYTYYSDKNTDLPVYMIIEYEYSKPMELKGIDISITISWDQDSGEIITTANYLGEKQTSTTIVPTDYWGILSSFDNLYIGYTEQINYVITQPDYHSDIDMLLEISITDIEGIIVPAGTFDNCYVVEFEQSKTNSYYYSKTSSKTKLWITKDGEFPQIQITIPSDTINIEMTAKLEGYYSTNN